MRIDAGKRHKWELRFLEVARLVAKWSEDDSRQVGAVIVGSGNAILATGYNGMPRGIDASLSERHSRKNGEKYHWFEHAERNAIYNAARNGVKLEGATLFCTSFPCSSCMSAIIQVGCKKLVTFAPDFNDQTYSRSFEVAQKIAEEGNLEVALVEP